MNLEENTSLTEFFTFKSIDQAIKKVVIDPELDFDSTNPEFLQKAYKSFKELFSEREAFRSYDRISRKLNSNINFSAAIICFLQNPTEYDIKVSNYLHKTSPKKSAITKKILENLTAWCIKKIEKDKYEITDLININKEAISAVVEKN